MATDLLIYFTAFVGPFVQEDAAIVGAVTAFLHPDTSKMASGSLIVTAMFCGLVVSDLWKYWIGYFGRTQNWAKKMATQPVVSSVADKIVANPGKTLMLARFIPGTRIPAYIAAGFFGVGFFRFAFWIFLSALVYVSVTAAALNTIGMVAGKTGQLYVSIGLVTVFLLFMIVKVLVKRSTDLK